MIEGENIVLFERGIVKETAVHDEDDANGAGNSGKKATPYGVS